MCTIPKDTVYEPQTWIYDTYVSASTDRITPALSDKMSDIWFKCLNYRCTEARPRLNNWWKQVLQNIVQLLLLQVQNKNGRAGVEEVWKCPLLTSEGILWVLRSLIISDFCDLRIQAGLGNLWNTCFQERKKRLDRNLTTNKIPQSGLGLVDKGEVSEGCSAGYRWLNEMKDISAGLDISANLWTKFYWARNLWKVQ